MTIADSASLTNSVFRSLQSSYRRRKRIEHNIGTSRFKQNKARSFLREVFNAAKTKVKNTPFQDADVELVVSVSVKLTLARNADVSVFFDPEIFKFQTLGSGEFHCVVGSDAIVESIHADRGRKNHYHGRIWTRSRRIKVQFGGVDGRMIWGNVSSEKLKKSKLGDHNKVLHQMRQIGV